MLGVCYGMQLIVHALGGSVSTPDRSEYGRTEVEFTPHALFEGVDSNVVWMNHTDSVTAMPEGFDVIARSNTFVAAIASSERRIYGLQFHPEVKHTVCGTLMLENFTKNICGCRADWSIKDLANTLINEIREKAGNDRLLCAFSGGVDSSVAAVLASKAVGDRLTCIFVDNGLMRLNEADEIVDFYKNTLHLNLQKADASERFLTLLAGVTEPEKKRKIIGETFIRVFEQEARRVGGDWLVQGTIYPDVIESGASKGGADVIKSHHNVGGLPKDIGFKGLIEPLRMLFKDEVRALGEELGIPHDMVWRQPFPGPGLAIRVIGEITPEKLEIVRKTDYILRDEVAKANLQYDIWQYFTVFTGVSSVGVKGDGRAYDNVIAIRAVTSADAMTVEFAELPYAVLRRASERMTNEVRGVGRVVYDITSKPPATIEWE